MRMRMTRKMVRSGVIPIRNSQFARNNYVPFCSFLFLCGLSCLNAGPRFGSQRVANSRGTRVLSRVFTNAARSLAPNLGLGERSFGVVRDPYWSGGLGWTASCHNSQRSARPDRLANVGAASFSPRAAALGKSALRRQPAACWSQSRCEYGTGWEEACVSQKHEMRFLSDFLFLRNGAGGVNRESDDCDDRHQHQTREILDHG